MNQIVQLDERESSLKLIGHISYLLHLIVAVGAVMPGAQASVALLIVAFQFGDGARADLVPGWIAWGVISIWFLYRVVRGWMKLNANLPMPQ